jgi:hypothetical protein
MEEPQDDRFPVGREERVRAAAAIEPAVLSYPLTDEQLKRYDTDGFLVVPGVVEPQLCDDIVAETWQRLESLFGLTSGTSPTSFSSPPKPLIYCW